MQALEPPDSHHLNAAIGWLELGNADEAQSEWGKITPENRAHPDALEIHWRICATRKNWPDALETARKLVQSLPDEATGWINQSYALHELKRTQEAWDQLLPAAEKFPKVSIIPYNLACYACQLDHPKLAQKYLGIAIDLKSKTEIKRRALADPDLKPLWDSIREL